MLYDIRTRDFVADCYSRNDFSPLYAVGEDERSEYPSMGLDLFLRITALEGYPLDRYIESVDDYFIKNDIAKWLSEQLKMAYTTPEIKDTQQQQAQRIVEALFNNKGAVYLLYRGLNPLSYMGRPNKVSLGYYENILRSEPLTRNTPHRDLYVDLVIKYIKCDSIKGPELGDAWPRFFDFFIINQHIQPDPILNVRDYLRHLETRSIDQENALSLSSVCFEAL